jgi:hypothetical protein
MTQYRQVPVFEQPIKQGENTSSPWYRYFQAHDLGQPPGAESVIKVVGSPFIYQAPRKGLVIVSGGTVSEIDYSRSGTFYNTGLTSGTFQVAMADRIRVIFSVAPTVVFSPS